MSSEGIQERAIRLRDGLRSEHQIYAGLLDISRRQKEVLLAGRTDEILALARSKEEILGRVEEIEKDIGPLKAQWAELREEVGDELRGEIEVERSRLQEVLQGLIGLEEEGQRSIDRLREETADKLRQVEGGRRLHRAYGQPRGDDGARYLDRSH